MHIVCVISLVTSIALATGHYPKSHIVAAYDKKQKVNQISCPYIKDRFVHVQFNVPTFSEYFPTTDFSRLLPKRFLAAVPKLVKCTTLKKAHHSRCSLIMNNALDLTVLRERMWSMIYYSPVKPSMDHLELLMENAERLIKKCTNDSMEDSVKQAIVQNITKFLIPDTFVWFEQKPCDNEDPCYQKSIRNIRQLPSYVAWMMSAQDTYAETVVKRQTRIVSPFGLGPQFILSVDVHAHLRIVEARKVVDLIKTCDSVDSLRENELTLMDFFQHNKLELKFNLKIMALNADGQFYVVGKFVLPHRKRDTGVYPSLITLKASIKQFLQENKYLTMGLYERKVRRSWETVPRLPYSKSCPFSTIPPELVYWIILHAHRDNKFTNLPVLSVCKSFSFHIVDEQYFRQLMDNDKAFASIGVPFGKIDQFILSSLCSIADLLDPQIEKAFTYSLTKFVTRSHYENFVAGLYHIDRDPTLTSIMNMFINTVLHWSPVLFIEKG